MDINKIILIDSCIKKRATGKPEQLAEKLGMTKRSVFNYIKFMREELNAPIEFNKYKESYTYSDSGEFNFKWKN